MNGIAPSVEPPAVSEEDELDEPISDPPRRRWRFRTRGSSGRYSSSSSSAGPSGINGGVVRRPPRRVLNEYLEFPSDSLSSSSQGFGDGPDGPLNFGQDEEEEDGGDGEGPRDKGKGRAEKAPSPDAEAEEADDNNELLDRLEKGAPGAGMNLKADSNEHWDKVVSFFKIHNKKDMEFSLPGLNYPMQGYQAAGVVWMLTRISEDAVAGAMLADAMGLGKTFTIIATIMSFCYLHAAYQEVEASWLARESKPRRRSPEEELGNRHNARDVAQKFRACPSQGKMTDKYGIECPCVLGSTSRAIADSMADLPSIIVCPSAGAMVWMSEWEKFVSTDAGTAAAQMKLYVHLTNYKGKMPGFHAFCEDMEAAQRDDHTGLEVDNNGALYKPRNGFKGGSANVLLMTQEVVRFMQDSKAPRTPGAFFSDADQLEPAMVPEMLKNWTHFAQAPIAGCGIFAMDEMHLYKGTSRMTQPFQLLNKFKYQPNPPLAVGISGNTMSIGPEGWHYLVEHTRDSIQRHPRLAATAQLGRLQNLAEYKAMTKDWNNILDNIDDGGPDGPSDDKLEQSKNNIGTDFKNIRKMIVRRAKTDYFRNVKVLDILPAVTTAVALRIPEGAALQDLSRNVQSIQQWVRNQYDQDMNNWIAAGRQGAKPQSVAARTQGGVLQDGIGNEGKGSERSRDAFYSSIRAATFPEVARIGRAPGTEHLVKYVHTSNSQKTDEETASLKALATAFTNTTLDPARTNGSVLETMKTSPFWKNRTAFKRSSTKYETLCRLVREQLLATRSDKENMPDKSGVRHMVVFTDAPLSAYLTALFLQGDFRGKVDVTLIHSDLKDRTASPRLYWKCRSSAFESFNSPCQPGDRNKVLVGTYRLISTMLNFQRASSAVLMDVPTTVQGQQARDRIHRRGQPLTALITEMWYENHIFEATRWKKNRGQQLMDEIDWQNFQSADEPGEAAGQGPAMEVDTDEEEEENYYD